MMTIDVDDNLLNKAEDALKHIPKATPKAVSAALNRAIQGSKTEASRKIREIYTIRAKDINETIAINKSTPTSLQAVIRSRGSSTAMSKFRVTPNRYPGKKGTPPVKAQIKKGFGGYIKGAFMARMKSGHLGVFRRSSGRSFPIVENFGPSVPQMLGNEAVIEYVEERTRERFEERLEYEIDRILRGIGG